MPYSNRKIFYSRKWNFPSLKSWIFLSRMVPLLSQKNNGSHVSMIFISRTKVRYFGLPSTKNILPKIQNLNGNRLILNVESVLKRSNALDVERLESGWSQVLRRIDSCQKWTIKWLDTKWTSQPALWLSPAGTPAACPLE